MKSIIIILTLIFTLQTYAQINLLSSNSSAFYVRERYESTKQLSDEVAKDILRELNEGKDNRLTLDKLVLTNEYNNVYTGDIFLSDGNYFSIIFSVKVVYDGSSAKWTIPPMQQWSINHKVKDINYVKTHGTEREIANKKQEEEKKKKLDALINGLNNSEGNGKGNEGDDNIPGDKGGLNGDPNAKGYYGNGGTGSTGNGDYNFGNRTPLNRPKPDYICNEEGLVVVRIEVDKNGNVTKATAGVEGSTTEAPCLLSQAEKAALQTKWNKDANAPSKQVGTIKYRFSLSQ